MEVLQFASILLTSSSKNVLRWTLSAWSYPSVLAGCGEPSLAHGLMGKRNVCLLSDPSRGSGIFVRCLSLCVLLHSLQSILLQWSCALLSPGISESCCLLSIIWKRELQASLIWHLLPQILDLVCGQCQGTGLLQRSRVHIRFFRCLSHYLTQIWFPMGVINIATNWQYDLTEILFIA